MATVLQHQVLYNDAAISEPTATHVQLHTHTHTSPHSHLLQSLHIHITQPHHHLYMDAPTPLYNPLLNTTCPATQFHYQVTHTLHNFTTISCTAILFTAKFYSTTRSSPSHSPPSAPPISCCCIRFVVFFLSLAPLLFSSSK